MTARRASQRGLDEGYLKPRICAADHGRTHGRCDGHRSVFGAAMPGAISIALIHKGDWCGHWPRLSENTAGAITCNASTLTASPARETFLRPC